MDSTLSLLLCLAVVLPVLLALGLLRQEALLRAATRGHQDRLFRARHRLAALMQPVAAE